MLDLQQAPLALAGRPQPRPLQAAQVAAQQTPRRASPVAHRPPPVRSMSASAVTLANGGYAASRLATASVFFSEGMCS
jgi:hypothetical protein